MPHPRMLPSLALLGLTSVAHAYSIDLAAHGSFTPGPLSLDVSDQVLYQDTTGGLPDFSNLNYDVSISAPYRGTGELVSGSDHLYFTFEYTSVIPANLLQTSEAAQGRWNYTSGTGAFSGLSGGGVISTNFNLGNSSTLDIFSGNLQPVPEPVSLAVLGVGLVGLVRRTRR